MIQRLEQCDHELQRAVFDSVYRSPGQRLLRLGAACILVFKHVTRGLAFSWPLYTLALAAAWLPEHRWLLLPLLLPALAVSGYILWVGVRSDYGAQVDRSLLTGGELGRLLFAGAGDG